MSLKIENSRRVAESRPVCTFKKCQTLSRIAPVQIYNFDISYLRFIEYYEDKNTTFDSV